MWAIIGGSGFEKFEGFSVVKRLETETPFGQTSSGICEAELNGHRFLFLSRHGLNHEILPSQINHKANMYALKKYGAKAIVSFSAVGSLKEELAPGDLVIPDQYIDRTKKSLKETTFFGDETLGNLVGHMSMGEPIDLRLFPILKNILKHNSSKVSSKLNKEEKSNTSLEFKNIENTETSFDFKTHFNKTYICMEGPNFSTRAESIMYRQWGADIIGMTHFPEYCLAREVNLLYVPMCFVTDYDSWRHEEEPVTLEEVIRIMKNNNMKAFSIIPSVLENKDLKSLYQDYHSGFPMGVMSPLESLNSGQKKIFEILCN